MFKKVSSLRGMASLPRLILLALLSVGSSLAAFAGQASVEVPVTSGWQMQDAAKVPEKGTGAGARISRTSYKPKDWYDAVVPGTVLTTLVKNGVYPEPLYGENNRPDRIPESLNKTSYWYRTVVDVPAAYRGRHVWLNLEGVNFSAEVWANGTYLGTMRGAFKRGIFDISPYVKAGEKIAIAVQVKPQPHPGNPYEHTIANGMVTNGGITAIDGPTFLCTIGWDWLPGIRDRDSGIWNKVYLNSTGPVVLKDPLVTTDLPLPKTDSAEVAISATLENLANQPETGTFHADFGDVVVDKDVQLGPKESKKVSLTSAEFASLHMQNPKLWWPNGYGPQNLYSLHLAFNQNGSASDEQTFQFGVRKITYSVPDSENLTVSVNGVRIFIRGGDWGLDEGMKRIPRERLEAEIRMHAIANVNLIRNWVGQSTGEDFYELCDKYGILLWDEFFQPNPSDGPNPDDLPTYMANVRDKILHYRNHPSIAIWCARNEGFPPKEIDDQLRVLMAELEPTRLYQPSSTSGHGVNSGGPYRWRTPREYYVYNEAFKTEIGSTSIPTIESIQGMMPQKDWEQIDDDWAEHDFARGASGSDTFPMTLAARYGKVANLADFVRKSQLANYEAYRAMYEGRSAKLFNPSTAIITWMSNPAQPSFVWQLYHHDLEPDSAMYAVKKAGEMVHIQLNQLTDSIEVINNTPEIISGYMAYLTIYDIDGQAVLKRELPVTGPGDRSIDIGSLLGPWDKPKLSPVYFVQLQLKNGGGKLVSENLYWHGMPDAPDDLTALNTMQTMALEANATRHDDGDTMKITLKLTNPGKEVALLTHVQLRHGDPGKTGVDAVNERVLPVFYSDNYISLVPGESRTIEIEADTADLKGEEPYLAFDGWNVSVVSAGSSVPVATNVNAQVGHWPVTGLPIVAHTWK
ncbi:sugar-binding domain-containing protein [Acidicapsa dinghuensis]|uniref:Sugar-binding domain-containing protein n=1 Tax=Acidicapsa dinghuensis TaxID=2218256 RepID=A0ABW1EMM9_9BACT|nr:sugar-binding domain-containing protein [Acidicapsa dinghuensis]